MTPSDMQAAAIKSIVRWYKDQNGPQEYYLAGYAGTGKSTVANMALNVLEEQCGVKTTCTGTFTGKAAAVLRKKGVANAQTIHSLIYRLIDPDAKIPEFELDPESKVRFCDLILLDEVSMVNKEMASDLRSFGKKILVMGDPGQLPPVRGEGAFTARNPDCFLTEIHRQAAGSPIIALATRARLGQSIEYGDYGDNVCVVPLNKRTEALIYEPHTQPICGVHKVRWTVTQRFREHLGFDGRVPHKGEKIICCRNDKGLGIYNGQMGTVVDCNGKPSYDLWSMLVSLEDSPPILDSLPVSSYLFRQHFEANVEKPDVPKSAKEFDWGYILTAHKSQGSEWPHVTVIDDSRWFREMAQKWLYTSITRASEGLTLMVRGR